MVNHPIKKGPEGGLHQRGKGYDRYLLDKKIKTGPQGGHYQTYDGGDKRYLLKAKSIKPKR
jgi:hypothetical protein